MEDFLDELYELTQIEQKRALTQKENDRYLFLWMELKENNVDINFAVEI